MEDNKKNSVIKVKTNNKFGLYNDKDEFNQHKFISDIYECEKQLYIFDNRLREIFVKTTVGPTDIPNDFKKSVEYKNYCKEYKKKSSFPKRVEKPKITTSDVCDAIITTGAIPGTIIGVIINIIVDIVKHGFYIWPTIVVALLVVAGSSIFNLAFYNSEMKKYNQYSNNVEQIKQYNSEVVKNNSAQYKYWENEFYKRKQSAWDKFDANERILLDNEADLIRKCKVQVENTLNSLYNLRINGVLCLHPNYQGLVPISVIYGYFDTGRCTQLQGHEGAYNLYEDEKMKGMIINKLDIVSQQLDNLNNTMSYVGHAIEECNEKLSELESTSRQMITSVNNMNSDISRQISGVSDKMSAVEANTANSAYYAEIGARMTTFNTVYQVYKDM